MNPDEQLQLAVITRRYQIAILVLNALTATLILLSLVGDTIRYNRIKARVEALEVAK